MKKNQVFLWGIVGLWLFSPSALSHVTHSAHDHGHWSALELSFIVLAVVVAIAVGVSVVATLGRFKKTEIIQSDSDRTAS